MPALMLHLTNPVRTMPQSAIFVFRWFESSHRLKNPEMHLQNFKKLQSRKKRRNLSISPFFSCFRGCIFFDHSSWQGQEDSNPRPTVLETGTLPAELYPCIRRIRRASYYITFASEKQPLFAIFLLLLFLESHVLLLGRSSVLLFFAARVLDTPKQGILSSRICIITGRWTRLHWPFPMLRFELAAKPRM